MAVVTNIDADHMDTYDHSLEKLKQAFVDFCIGCHFMAMPCCAWTTPMCAASCHR